MRYYTLLDLRTMRAKTTTSTSTMAGILCALRLTMHATPYVYTPARHDQWEMLLRLMTPLHNIRTVSITVVERGAATLGYHLICHNADAPDITQEFMEPRWQPHIPEPLTSQVPD